MIRIQLWINFFSSETIVGVGYVAGKRTQRYTKIICWGFDIVSVSTFIRIFTGDMNDRQRKEVLSRYNSPKNRYGKLIKVLLVTEAGAEGISLLETRHLHI